MKHLRHIVEKTKRTVGGESLYSRLSSNWKQVKMDVKHLLRIDRWLGIPLCFGHTMIRKALRISSPDYSTLPRNILFIKLAEQGSTVLAYPALHRAVEKVGRENVYFVVFEENRFILDLLDIIPESNVLTICTKNFWSLLTSVVSTIRRLRHLHLDAAVDMEFFSRGAALLTDLSGAKRRIGYHRPLGTGPYCGDLRTHRMPYNSHLHTSESFLCLIEAAFQDPKALPAINRPLSPFNGELPRFTPSRDEIEAMQELIRHETGTRPSLVLLNPNASDLLPLRRWPVDYYIQLARRLLENYPELYIAFTGSPNESAQGRALAQRVDSPRCFSLVGKTTLRQLLVLYGLSSVLVTNDSGPAHFAALTPIRVVTLFGPETPILFGARTPRNISLWAKLPCSPCVDAFNARQSSCRRNFCMEALSVDLVFDEVCKAYEQSLVPGAILKGGLIVASKVF